MNATASGQTNTIVYTAKLDATTIEQSYTFYNESTDTDFAGLNFTIKHSSLKWSISLSIDDLYEGNSTENADKPITLSYKLAAILTGGDANAPISVKRYSTLANTPTEGVTTYILPLSTLSAAELQVLDVALIDDELQPIEHRIVTQSGGAPQEAAVYVLEVTFPPFNNSVFYDPSLGLGVLLGSSGENSGGGDNNAVVIGVAVAVPLAVLIVVSVTGIGAAVIYWRKRQRAETYRSRLCTMHSQLVDNQL